MKYSHLTQLLLILFIALLLSSCCARIDKAALTIKGKYVLNNDFRMDGIYTSQDGLSEGSLSENYYRTMYFFQDGYIYKVLEENPFSDNNICSDIPETFRIVPYFWGCFTVKGSDIYIQSYFPKNELDRKVEHFWGKIENDTTIRLYEHMDDRKKTKKINELYRFRQCDNKPDSTNMLMTF